MESFRSAVRPAQPTVATSALFSALVDDAGLFPPEQLDMAAAAARHRRDQAAASPVLSHRFVVPAARLSELQGTLTGRDRFAVSVIGPAESEPVEELLAVVAADGRLTLAGLESVLPQDWAARTDDLSAAIRLLPSTVPVFLEVPIRDDNDQVLDLLAGEGWSAKLRCGGVRSELFPTTEHLAITIRGCVGRAIPFKATAGLHHAVRYQDPTTGFTHHGFLNILLAVARAVDGAGQSTVVDVLQTSDPQALRHEVDSLPPTVRLRTREVFQSYGSCSTDDPLDDLTTLSLLT